MKVECPYGGPDHEYPDDWTFGGANGKDPAADPRFQVTNYVYLDDKFEQIWHTSSPRCDDQAIDEFTFVAGLGPSFNPKYLQARRPDGTQVSFKLTYDKATDVVREGVMA